MYGTMGSIVLVWGVAESNLALSSFLRVLDEAEMVRLDVEAVNCDAVSAATESLALPDTEDVEKIEQPSRAVALDATTVASRAEFKEAGESFVY